MHSWETVPIPPHLQENIFFQEAQEKVTYSLLPSAQKGSGEWMMLAYLICG